MLRTQLDAAPFASVFFLLVIFMMLASLIYTPGARLELQLPQGKSLPGTDKPPVTVAVDADGRLYYDNQWIEEKALRGRLQEMARKSPEPLTLVVKADKTVSYERLMRLALLARDAGIPEALLATLPGPVRALPAMTTMLVEPRPWARRRWGGMVALVFVVQLGLIFWLGSRTPIRPRLPTAALTLYLGGTGTRRTAGAQ